jgi:hypothetical protein
MVTKPYFLNIVTIKQLFPRILLVVGLALACLVSIPNWALSASPVTEPIKDSDGNLVGTKTTILHGSGGSKTIETTYNVGPESGTHRISTYDDKGKPISDLITKRDGTRAESHTDASGGGTGTTIYPGGAVYTEKFGPDSKQITLTKVVPYPNGTVTTQTIDFKTGTSSAIAIKDAKGKVTTALPDGKGGFTSVVKGEHGNVATSTYDREGQLNDVTTRDKQGKVISTTEITLNNRGRFNSVTKDGKGQVISTTAITNDGKGGFNSVTTDKNGKVVSSTVLANDGKVVSQTGKKQIMSLGTSGQSTGGTQTSQGSGKHKDKENLQTQVIHQDKEKSNVQSPGSSGTSSGSGQQSHHRRH